MAGKRSWFWNILSFAYLCSAVWLLVVVCSHCYPTLEGSVRNAVLGWEDSPVREAFDTLADELESGEPVKEAFSACIEVLIHETD